MNIPIIDTMARPTEEAAINQIARGWDLETLFEEKLRMRQVFDCQKCQIVTINLKHQHVSLTANDLLARWDGEGSLVNFLERFTWQ